MTQILTLNDLKPEQLKQRRKVFKEGDPDSVTTTLFRAKADTLYAPTAALNYYPSGAPRYSAAHFHEQDQFQIIMEGGGEFGRHHVSPYCVHFSRAYTAYGPLQSDKETGWMFMVLRTRYDSGAQRFPQALEKLKQTGNRQPWQITKKATFPQLQTAQARLEAIPDIQDEKGLYAGTLSMAPNTQMLAPHPSNGDGQYVVIIKGSLIHDGNERKATGVVFIRPDEQAFEINSGPDGLQAFILNFPKISQATQEDKVATPAGNLKKWKCSLCAFEYDEAAGMPEEGIVAGTRWEDVPETWNCPDCSASKSDFEMVEVGMH